jgi:cytochrome b6-f complex iron-sulfur subunit
MAPEMTAPQTAPDAPEPPKPPVPSKPSSKPPDASRLQKRRGFLQKCLGTLSGFGFLAALYPIIRYIEPPPESEGANRVEIDAAELPPGASRTVIYRGRPTVVVNGAQGYVAYVAVCTHLGCIVKWAEESQEFRCPCHGGKFNTKGEVLGGPVPGPLTPVNVTLSGGKVIVGA